MRPSSATSTPGITETNDAPRGRASIDGRRSSARLALLIGAHVALAVVGFAVDRWFVWIGVWAIQAMSMLTLIAMIHECVHSHFVTSRRANRVIGTLASAFAFTPYEIYKARHILHHSDTCGPGDTEGEPYKFSSRWQIVGSFAVGGVAYIVQLAAMGILVSLGWKRPWIAGPGQVRRVRQNQVVLVAVYALAVALAVVDLRAVAFAWFIPVAIFLSLPFVFVLLPEHYDAPGPAEVTENTRTCVSNGAMRFVFLNTNLHTAHHDKASVPWSALPEHHATLVDRIDDEWVFSGYWAFYRFMWRTIGRRPNSELAAA